MAALGRVALELLLEVGRSEAVRAAGEAVLRESGRELIKAVQSRFSRRNGRDRAERPH